MKTHKERQEILIKTLEFILKNIESKKDFNMLNTTMQDYREMGYSIEKFEVEHQTRLLYLNEEYGDEGLFEMRGIYWR